MARLNKGRTIAAEANLADRIRMEREARSLTNEGLAKLMTDAGCAMQGSAIFKIEKGEPRRRISVDELVAFAAVFETTVEDLLTPVDLLRKERAKKVVADVEAARERMVDAAAALVAAFSDFFDLAGYDPELREYAENHLFPVEDEVEDESLFTVEVDGEPVDVDESKIRETFMAFQLAIIEMAEGVENRVIDANMRKAGK
ncbi:hypothetical protein USB125703_02062 [Pseudoclavibacter triregionum]|nr:hypothetical protein USB125703_02062 [Pseudoclavibacter triregionum]